MTFAVVTLHDRDSSSTAQILPGFGFNCYRLAIDEGGEPVEVLWSDPAIEEGRARPSGSGIPVLFPFPGRLPGDSFEFGGKTYTIANRDALGNAIHGFVLDRGWEVVDQQSDSVTGRFNSTSDATLRQHWPGDFRITMTYVLKNRELTAEVVLENPGSTPLPWGFGIHPYFRVPLDASGEADRCLVHVPVREHWVLKDMLPTGERQSLPADYPLAQGMEFRQTKFDDVFSGVAVQDQHCLATVTDPANKRRLELEFDPAFPVCVVYNPPHREAVCVEPYTCVPGLPVPADASQVGHGLQIMQPGEQRTLRFAIRLRQAD